MILLFLGSGARPYNHRGFRFRFSVLRRHRDAVRRSARPSDIMTLGGLALAVRHPGRRRHRHHRETSTGIWSTARRRDFDQWTGPNQIVTPAFVSLLCICIVVSCEMFFPGRAWRAFLFRADGRSGDVRDDLVGSCCRAALVRRWRVRCCSRMCSTRRRKARPPTRKPAVRFQRAFEARFERVTAAATAIC